MATPQAITEDDTERLTICLRVLAERNEMLTQVFGEGSREALGRLLTTREAEAKKNKVSNLLDISVFLLVISCIFQYSVSGLCALNHPHCHTYYQ